MYSDFFIFCRSYVLEVMSDNKEKWFVYHNIDHVFEVLERTNYLAKNEGLDLEKQEILQIAALFHDISYKENPSNHEQEGADFAFNFLIKYDFPEDKADIIRNLILATKLDSNPSNLLEWIIKDADIDNFWRDDFFEKGNLVKKEVEMLTWDFIPENKRAENISNIMEKIYFYSPLQKNERQHKFEENKEKIKKIALWE